MNFLEREFFNNMGNDDLAFLNSLLLGINGNSNTFNLYFTDRTELKDCGKATWAIEFKYGNKINGAFASLVYYLLIFFFLWRRHRQFMSQIY